MERRQIVEKTMKPGASVSRIARARDINANQIFHWRKLYREGLLEVEAGSSALLPEKISNKIAKPAAGRETKTPILSPRLHSQITRIPRHRDRNRESTRFIGAMFFESASRVFIEIPESKPCPSPLELSSLHYRNVTAALRRGYDFPGVQNLTFSCTVDPNSMASCTASRCRNFPGLGDYRFRGRTRK
ncbi:MAG TPA: transposase [Terriglobia bacterium]|nr:transposase [Terriglobia bacterium]